MGNLDDDDDDDDDDEDEDEGNDDDDRNEGVTAGRSISSITIKTEEDVPDSIPSKSSMIGMEEKVEEEVFPSIINNTLVWGDGTITGGVTACEDQQQVKKEGKKEEEEETATAEKEDDNNNDKGYELRAEGISPNTNDAVPTFVSTNQCIRRKFNSNNNQDFDDVDDERKPQPKKKTRVLAVVEADINCEANGYHTTDGGGDSNCTSSKTCGNLQQDFIGQQQQQQQNNAGVGVGAVGAGGDPERVIRQQQQRLLLLRHASKCKLGSACTTKFCAQMKPLWQHMKKCRDRDCTTRHCQSSRCVLTHYRICKSQGNTATCEICGPVMEHIRKQESNDGLVNTNDPLTEKTDAADLPSHIDLRNISVFGAQTDVVNNAQVAQQQLAQEQQALLQQQQQKVAQLGGGGGGLQMPLGLQTNPDDASSMLQQSNLTANINPQQLLQQLQQAQLKFQQ